MDVDVHGRFVVRAQEAHAFFCDLGELEEGDHLEAVEGGVISACCFFFFVVIEKVGKGERTLHCLLTRVSSIQSLSMIGSQPQVPVKILCGHDCSLCAPPTASSVFCPGFKPLQKHTKSVHGVQRCISMFSSGLRLEKGSRTNDKYYSNTAYTPSPQAASASGP